jgi:hypothetical protein
MNVIGSTKMAGTLETVSAVPFHQNDDHSRTEQMSGPETASHARKWLASQKIGKTKKRLAATAGRDREHQPEPGDVQRVRDAHGREEVGHDREDEDRGGDEHLHEEDAALEALRRDVRRRPSHPRHGLSVATRPAVRPPDTITPPDGSPR